MGQPLLNVKDLRIHFRTDGGVAEIVSGISFYVNKGETVGIVGESGCGKSVTSMAILGLLPSPPLKKIEGEILFDGTDLLKLKPKEIRKRRGRDISMIFQDPLSSLDPAFTVGHQIDEAILFHEKLSKEEVKQRSIELLRRVGIANPEQRYHEYPHQYSGGMRQRVMIAMALACNPKLIIADEPTTALDVTVQAQILDLMKNLTAEFGTAFILITHDMGVVAEMCSRVLVMYAGQIVEEAPVEELFDRTAHPYTEGLLASVPSIDGPKQRLYSIKGSIPAPNQMPKGCRFSTRCAYATSRCSEEEPDFQEVAPGHRVKCWHYEEVLRKKGGDGH